ncbi:MAG: MFS transporter [Pseudonocardiales bacterium]
MTTVSATSQELHQTPTIESGTAPSAVLRRRLSRGPAFWLVAATVSALLAASSAPSPLYPVLQAEFGFSALTLTGIFAVYVVALLLSLLTVGRLSDYVGRRPVLAVALVIEAASMAVFLGADRVTWLVVARIVQGVATGAAVGVLGAYLLDLQPSDGSRLGSLVNSVAATTGLGIGSVLTGVLVQYAPHPTKLIFALLMVVFALLVLATAALPETVSRVPGALAALRPRVAVPPRARRAFVGALPTMMSTWALGGLMLSVGGSLLGVVFAQANEAVIGLVIGVFALSGAIAAVAVTNIPPHRISTLGTGALVVGTGLFLIGIDASSLGVFVIATAVAGAGFGSAFLGALRSVTQLAEPHERAALLSAVFIVSYLAFSIPAVLAGLLITHIGLRDTSLYYGTLVGVLAGTSLAISVGSARAKAAPR